MEWVETTGTTVEAALESALDVLGVEQNEAEYEILEEPKSGFLGMSKKPARVRARVRPSTPASKDQRRQRRSRKPEGSREKDPVARDGAKRQEVSRNAPRAVTANVKDTEVEDEETQGEQEPRRELSRMDLAVAAQHFLADLLHELDFAGTVAVDSLDDEAMELSINGENLGGLIGVRGSVISSVQEVTRAVIQGHAGESAGRVSVDIAGYRKKRREALERFASGLVVEVVETGEEREIDPMIASERKIIHDVVGQHDGVGSRSEGEEPNRRVVIFKVDDEAVGDSEEE